jgi:glutamate racemase
LARYPITMLGFFDSGFGGLSVVREIRKRLPRYAITYLGDNARTPYGSRSAGVIHQYTLEGVEELFRRGAELIVVACNTSSSVALRKIQQEYLPERYPGRRVLGIVIPTAEEVSAASKTKTIGILATEATVNSLAYPQEIWKIDAKVRVHQQPCPRLVPLIESGELDSAATPASEYVDNLLARDARIDTILLGCTHYALIEPLIRAVTPESVRVVSQGAIVAAKLEDYLRRHPEMERRLDRSGDETFLSTENSPRIQTLATRFFGEPLKIEMVKLSHPGGVEGE